MQKEHACRSVCFTFNDKIRLRKKGDSTMDVHEKLQQLLDERGWTKYQLARKCGLA